MCVSDNVPPAFLPSGASPLPTTPVSLRSMCQLSCAPSGFLSVKAKMAPPCFIASLRSVSDEERDEEMRSKAAEEGKASVVR